MRHYTGGRSISKCQDLGCLVAIAVEFVAPYFKDPSFHFTAATRAYLAGEEVCMHAVHTPEEKETSFFKTPLSLTGHPPSDFVRQNLNLPTTPSLLNMSLRPVLSFYSP